MSKTSAVIKALQTAQEKVPFSISASSEGYVKAVGEVAETSSGYVGVAAGRYAGSDSALLVALSLVENELRRNPPNYQACVLWGKPGVEGRWIAYEVRLG